MFIRYCLGVVGHGSLQSQCPGRGSIQSGGPRLTITPRSSRWNYNSPRDSISVSVVSVLYYTFVKILLLCNRISHAVHFLQYRSLASCYADYLLCYVDFSLGYV